MKIKTGIHGARAKGIQPEILLAIIIADGVWKSLGTVELVITCLTDSHKHRPKSLHNKGQAVDLRTNNLAAGVAQNYAGVLRQSLGQDYDVVIEPSHLHLEFDPKG